MMDLMDQNYQEKLELCDELVRERLFELDLEELKKIQEAITWGLRFWERLDESNPTDARMKSKVSQILQEAAAFLFESIQPVVVIGETPDQPQDSQPYSQPPQTQEQEELPPSRGEYGVFSSDDPRRYPTLL